MRLSQKRQDGDAVRLKAPDLEMKKRRAAPNHAPPERTREQLRVVETLRQDAVKFGEQVVPGERVSG